MVLLRHVKLLHNHMKRLALFSLVLCCCTLSSFAQNATSSESDAVKRIAVGIQGGLIRPANESGWEGHQNLSPTFGIFALFRNGIGSGLSPELNIAYAKQNSDDTLSYSAYETGVISADVRLRWYPLAQDASFSPYLSAGVGLLIPSNKIPAVVTQADFKKDNAALCFPLTAGLTHNVSDNLALDLNVGWTLSTTDDINPRHDDTNDGWFGAKIGLAYSFGPIEKDSDDDGLSDKDEISRGTNPNNPDTDGDTLNDGDEVLKYKTDPLNADTDDGGVNDGVEVKRNTSPLDVADDIFAIEVGETIQIRNIEFETGKSDISPKSERILNKVLEAMNKNSSMELEVSGHTDNVGSHDSNMELSNNRAKSVKDWLVAKGVSGDRLTAQGYGPDKPTKSNDTAEGRRRNRRVEFRRMK